MLGGAHFVDAKHHIIYGESRNIVLCPADNDVLALLEMKW